jgi:hypothetical protein
LAEEIEGGRFGFEYLDKCVIDALLFEGLPPERLTDTAARMVAIVGAERSRMKRVRDWANRPPPIVDAGE